MVATTEVYKVTMVEKVLRATCGIVGEYPEMKIIVNVEIKGS